MRRTLVSAVAAAAVTASLFAATPAQAAEVDIKGSGSSFAGNFLIDCASRYTAKLQEAKFPTQQQAQVTVAQGICCRN
jgi:ABC-type phosphate transport system substrate-binding protein